MRLPVNLHTNLVSWYTNLVNLQMTMVNNMHLNLTK
jgi:hypothetical protein